MPKALTNAKIEELSLVFKTDPKTGAEFAPRNDMARILSVKGAATSPKLVGKLLQALKGYFSPEWMGGVTEPVADGVDGDNDGGLDYNELIGAICELYYDLQACMGIMDNEKARSVAIKTVFDGFLEELDLFRAGQDPSGKAGARHSKEDMAQLTALGKHLQNAVDTHAKLMPSTTETQADKEEKKNDKGDGEGEDDAKSGPVSPSIELGEDGRPVWISGSDTKVSSNEVLVGIVFENKAKAKDDKKPYGDVEYADPKNGKYPIDTKAHAKSAWSYINKESNAAEYDADELAKVKGKIKAACEKFGVEIGDKAAPVVGELVPVTVKLDTDAMKGVVTEIGSMLETFKGDINKTLEEHAAAVDGKIETILAPVTDELAQKTTQVTALSASVAAMQVANARKASAVGGNPSFDGESFRANGFVTETKGAVLIPEGTDFSTAFRMLIGAEQPPQ